MTNTKAEMEFLVEGTKAEIQERIDSLTRTASNALEDLEKIAHEHEMPFTVTFNGGQELKFHKHVPVGFHDYDDEDEEIFGYELPDFWISSSMYC